MVNAISDSATYVRTHGCGGWATTDDRLRIFFLHAISLYFSKGNCGRTFTFHSIDWPSKIPTKIDCGHPFYCHECLLLALSSNDNSRFTARKSLNFSHNLSSKNTRRTGEERIQYYYIVWEMMHAIPINVIQTNNKTHTKKKRWDEYSFIQLPVLFSSCGGWLGFVLLSCQAHLAWTQETMRWLNKGSTTHTHRHTATHKKAVAHLGKWEIKKNEFHLSE